jgi:hypothetical protein
VTAPGAAASAPTELTYDELQAPPFGWPALAEVRRYLPTSHLDGAAWVALWQAELRSPGTWRLWDLGRVHALVLLMERGWEPEPIEIEGRAIADGNHRAAAARALGRLVGVVGGVVVRPG